MGRPPNTTSPMLPRPRSVGDRAASPSATGRLPSYAFGTGRDERYNLVAHHKFTRRQCMAVQIPRKRRGQLVWSIDKRLRTAKASPNGPESVLTFLDGLLTPTDELSMNHEEWLLAKAEYGLPNLSGFLLSKIAEIMDPETGALTRFDSSRKLAERWLSEFEALPVLYEFLVPTPLPKEVGDHIGSRYVLSDALHLSVLEPVVFDGLRATGAPFWPLTNSGTDPFATEPPCFRSHLVLHVRVGGWNLLDDEDPLGRAPQITREFLGMCMATGLLEIEKPASDAVVPVICGELATGPEGQKHLRLDKLKDWYPEDVLPARDARTAAGCRPPKEAAGDGFVQRKLHLIGTAFRTNQRRMLDGAACLFSSFGAAEPAEGLFQTVKAMEIVLGGTKEEQRRSSISAILADRCASLLGSDPEARERITREVKYVYDLRSRFAHGNLSRLPDDALSLARNLAFAALGKQAQFLAVTNQL